MRRIGHRDEETGDLFFIDIFKNDSPEDMAILSEALRDDEVIVEEFGAEEVRVRAPVHLYE